MMKMRARVTGSCGTAIVGKSGKTQNHTGYSLRRSQAFVGDTARPGI
jgi:hypothetical protein